VSGAITSQAAETSQVAEVALALYGTGVPILINTGFKVDNAVQLLEYADGAVVGSSLKVDGVTWNPVDGARVTALMDVVRSVRS
ncbi:MAG: SgcQ protein, partial [Chloroflexota bacterium]|nr:SgcQ protein [Chloroflexota bacterium]